jgi:ribosomal protein S18 acetylase RimI-like enzyme
LNAAARAAAQAQLCANEDKMTSSDFGIPPAELNRRIQAYLRAFALRMEDHERIGPFLAGFDAGSDNLYRNYAVPDDDATPTADEINAFVAAFARRKRVPRLEYVAEAAPHVEPALTAKGFVVEDRFPLLVCGPGMLRGAHADDVDIVITRSEADIVAAAEVGADAYGGEVYPDPLRRLVQQGGVLALARDRKTGLAVGAGMATPAHEGTSEVAGIGVRSAFRRHGIAGALTGAITREAFARGVSLAWMVPGHDGAGRVYARAGFTQASEQLHISKRD